MKEKNMDGSEELSKVFVSSDSARKGTGRIDHARIRDTSEADIQRQKVEDNHPRTKDLGAVRFPNAGANVSELRAKFGISQEEFAKRFGLSLRTVQQWEQKRRVPDGPAGLLLRVIAENPEAVERVVRDR
jgi:putative transcriptional regulator